MSEERARRVAVTDGDEGGAAALPGRVAAAALVAQPFVLYLLALMTLAPADPGQWAHADPIIRLLPLRVVVAAVPAASVLAAAAWWRVARPRCELLVRACKLGLCGALVAGGAALVLRGIAGPALPAFIPAEESAAPGYLLSMTAGYGEEVVFRLLVLPLLAFGLSRKLGHRSGVALAVVVTGLAFALAHAAGPEPWSWAQFATRTLLPGCLMSAAFFVVDPAFVVIGHAAAHLLIPALFTG